MAGAKAGVMFVILAVFCFVVPNSLAKEYTVGDAAGWSMNVDYSTWTSDKTFAVGDTLVFNYGGGHTVDEVGETDYTSCTIGNSLTSDSSGASSIVLNTPGTHYFICGAMGHCDSGMKLAVTVAADQTPTNSTTPVLPSPLPNTPTSTLPSVPLLTTPPPPSTTPLPTSTPTFTGTLPSTGGSTLPSPLPTPTSTKALPSPLPSLSSPSTLLAPTPLLAPTTTTNLAPPFAEASSTSTITSPTLLALFLIGMTLFRVVLY